MSNIVQYGSYSIEAANAEAKELERASGSGFLRLGEGEHYLRFLPPPVGAESPFVTAHQHFIRMPGEEKPISFNCPRMMARGQCPACAKAEQLRSTGDSEDYKLAGQFFAKLRIYANVIDREAEELGPQIFAYGKTIQTPLTAIRGNKREGGDFTDPTSSGFDIVITRAGTGQFDTEYSVRRSIKFSPLGDMSWIEQQADLSRYKKVPTIDEIKSQLGIADAPPQRGAPVARGKALATKPVAAVSNRRAPSRTVENDLEDDE